MSIRLEAIAEELRRLQCEGINRVFVKDDTLGLLKPAPKASKPEDTVTPPKKVQSAVALEAEVSNIKSVPSIAPTISLPPLAPTQQLDALRAQVLACPVCNEHLSTRGKIVFGEGPIEADILFCGEAPGADEELTGLPFVGKAGQLLAKIITAMGLSREAVYITNILKWRPEHDKPYGNRPPTPEEMNYCLPYLKAQIEIIRPKVIVALGNTAVSGVLGPDPSRRMGQVRGTWETFQDIPLMITFHPSYLLRNDTLKTKRMVWEDMLQVMEKTGLAINDRQRGYFLPKT